MAVEAVRYGGMGVVVMSDHIAAHFGQMPPFWDQIRENKVGSCLFLWFVGGTISQNMQQTGAFEIYFDGTKVVPSILRIKC